MTIASPLPLDGAVSARRWRSPAAAYWLAAACLFGPAAYFYLVDPFGTWSPIRDVWHHIAVLRELMASPLAPSNPHVVSDAGSRYFGPIFVALAVVGRALGLDAWQAFGLGAVLSLALLALGTAGFARRYFVSPWAPLVLLLCLLFAWGLQPTSHVGFHNYRTFWVSAGYPASMLVGLSFLLWAEGLRLADGSDRPERGVLIVAALVATAVTTHQLGAGLALGGLALFTAFRTDVPDRRRWLVAAGAAAGLLAAKAWPYFDPYAILASAGDTKWQSPTLPPESLGTLFSAAGLAIVGLFGLYDRSTRRVDIPLSIGIAGLMLVWNLGRLADSPITHRLLPMIVLFLQIALAGLILRLVEHRRIPRPALALTAALLVCGYGMLKAAEPLIAEAARRDSHGDPLVALGAFENSIPPDAVFFADERVVYPIQSTGRRVASLPRPEPTVVDMPDRQAATARFFAPTTSNGERLALARRYGASFAAMSRAQTPAATQASLVELGPVSRFGTDMLVVRLPTETRQ